MKSIKVNKVVFDSEEISALQMVACIDCVGVDCNECPLNGADGICLKSRVKSALTKNNISW